MTRRPFITVLAALALTITGCGADLLPLPVSEQDSLAKIRTGQFTLINNQELATLRQGAETGKNMGRYQMHREGFRTWRLDTASGKICLLLASESDWKKGNLVLQSCALNVDN